MPDAAAPTAHPPQRSHTTRRLFQSSIALLVLSVVAYLILAALFYTGQPRAKPIPTDPLADVVHDIHNANAAALADVPSPLAPSDPVPEPDADPARLWIDSHERFRAVGADDGPDAPALLSGEPSHVIDARPGDEHWPRLLELLPRAEPAAAQARAAAHLHATGRRYKVIRNPDDAPAFRVGDPNASELFAAARTLARYTRAQLRRPDPDPLTPWNIAALASAARQLRGIALLDQTRAASLTTAASDILVHALRTHPDLFTDDDLTTIDAALAAASDQTARSPDRRAQRIEFESLLARKLTADGRAWRPAAPNLFRPVDSPPQRRGPIANVLDLLAIPVSALRVADAQEHLAAFDRAATLADAPIPPLLERSRPTDFQAEWDRMIDQHPRYAVLNSNVHLTRSTKEFLAAAAFHAHLARTAVAFERSRRDTGAFPAHPDQLVPHYLDALPLDPADHQPLRHRSRPGRPPLLYSLGPDGDDDNAQPLPHPDPDAPEAVDPERPLRHIARQLFTLDHIPNEDGDVILLQ